MSASWSACLPPPCPDLRLLWVRVELDEANEHGNQTNSHPRIYSKKVIVTKTTRVIKVGTIMGRSHVG